jgi:uncharacterized alkaline shock family protein YloU
MEVNGPVSDPPPGDHPATRRLLSSATLACGADVDLLLEQVAEGRGPSGDAHQQQCMQCQAALTEFTALWRPVAELAAVPVAPPPGLAAAVMSQVRALVRNVWYTLEATETGVIRIAARIVAALARDCARLIPGVRVALGRSTEGRAAALADRATGEHRYPDAAVGVLGRTAIVDLAVAVTGDDPVHVVAQDIQRQVIATLRDQTGLQDITVNVTVDDIVDDDER